MEQLNDLKKALEKQLAAVNETIRLLGERNASAHSGEVLDFPISASREPRMPIGSPLSNFEIKQAILEIQGEFESRNLNALLKQKFPNREIKKGTVSTVLFQLKKSGKVEQKALIGGNQGAFYEVLSGKSA